MKARSWLLLLASLLALAGGGVYFWQLQTGLRGADLLGFTCWAVCPLLVLSLLTLFIAMQYLKR
jgi:hypothetical protein